MAATQTCPDGSVVTVCGSGGLGSATLMAARILPDRPSTRVTVPSSGFGNHKSPAATAVNWVAKSASTAASTTRLSDAVKGAVGDSDTAGEPDADAEDGGPAPRLDVSSPSPQPPTIISSSEPTASIALIPRR